MKLFVSSEFLELCVVLVLKRMFLCQVIVTKKGTLGGIYEGMDENGHCRKRVTQECASCVFREVVGSAN